MDLSAMMRHFLLFLLIFLALVAYSCGNTDPTDVVALENLYTSLDYPPQLTGWSSSGGDPCSQSWKGVKCSGSAVTEIKLSGLGLTGSLGYQLSSLTSLKTLDLSNNHIQNSIPYQLPPNATSINLGSNSLNGVLPYSLSAMSALNFLNVSHNALSGQISDVFGKLTQLSTLDLSFNTFGQDLPSSFSSLSNLSSLYLQNNQLTGSVDSLSGIPLKTLNIENNHFTGWLPKTFPNNPLFKTAGNNFNQGPSPPSPPYHSPIPYQKPVDARNRNNNARNKTTSDVSSQPHTDEKTSSKGLSHGVVAGIIIGSILAACMASLVFVFSYRRPPNRASREKSLINDSASLSPLSSFSVKVPKVSTELKPKSSPPPMVLRPPPSDRHKSNAEKTFDRKLVTKLARSPIIAESYSIADL